MSRVPDFIARAAKRAIDAASNPSGMQTNGPAMARIEASLLSRLLQIAEEADLSNTAVEAPVFFVADEELTEASQGRREIVGCANRPSKFHNTPVYARVLPQRTPVGLLVGGEK